MFVWAHNARTMYMYILLTSSKEQSTEIWNKRIIINKCICTIIIAWKRNNSMCRYSLIQIDITMIWELLRCVFFFSRFGAEADVYCSQYGLICFTTTHLVTFHTCVGINNVLLDFFLHYITLVSFDWHFQILSWNERKKNNNSKRMNR